jgi:hypothetical protein
VWVQKTDAVGARKQSELPPVHGVLSGAELDPTRDFHAHYRLLLHVLFQVVTCRHCTSAIYLYLDLLQIDLL